MGVVTDIPNATCPMTSDRIAPDMPSRTHSRSIRRRLLGCERLESRSMLAADFEVVDTAALVDAQLPPDAALFVADPHPMDSVDSAAGDDWQFLIAVDVPAVVITDWTGTSSDGTLLPEFTFDDGAAWLGDLPTFDVSSDGGQLVSDLSADAPDPALDDSMSLFPIAYSSIPQGVESFASAVNSPATLDASLLAWGGLASNSVPVPSLPAVAASAPDSPGAISSDTWARLGGSAASPAAQPAVDLLPKTDSPAVDQPSGDPPSPTSTVLGELVVAELPLVL